MILEDNLNLAVFCSESILKHGKGIDSVFHDEDGDFQFISNQEEDGKICLLSLEEVVDIDASVKEVLDIPIGYVAFRVSPLPNGS